MAVESMNDSLDQTTNYSYSLRYEPNEVGVAVGLSVTASAVTPFGVVYAMETLLQIVTPEAQASCGGGFIVVDEPDYEHRGLLLDTGRRFYPLKLLESTIDAMAMFKLNVLHLHLNENRFRVESKIFPMLNQPLNCSECGYYSQEDIKHLVAFAYERGVRLVPEFELTAHAAALCDAWKDEGVPKCCSGIYTPQLPDDKSGNTSRLVGRLLKEMASLFPDPVIHIGGDEARYQPGATGPCTINATRSLQENTMRQLLTLGKQPMGWQEILLETGAATTFPTAIIDTWSKPGTWAEVAALGGSGRGHRSVVSLPSSLYLDGGATCGGYTHRGSYRPGVWFDITDGAKNGVGNRPFLHSSHHILYCRQQHHYFFPDEHELCAHKTRFAQRPTLAICSAEKCRCGRISTSLDGRVSPHVCSPPPHKISISADRSARQSGHAPRLLRAHSGAGMRRSAHRSSRSCLNLWCALSIACCCHVEFQAVHAQTQHGMGVMSGHIVG